jgi:predicted dehydrogenase
MTQERAAAGPIGIGRVGIGVVGFGWMGQAHSRGFRRIPSIFADRPVDPALVVCADSDASRRAHAVSGFGFAEATDDWRKVVEHPDVDVVVIAGPNMMHVDVAVAAMEAGKHVLCEKPVGGTPEQTARAEHVARRTGVVTAVGYNYRWAPLVLHAKELIDSGRIGRVTNYRGRFLSCYGADPLGTLSWRYLVDEGGHGVSSDLLSHAIDLAMFLVGPIAEVCGTGETFITDRPLATAGGTHYDRGDPSDPTGRVTNEDWFGALVRFTDGAVGTFEASRSMVGPESQNVLEVYGTQGALVWSFERMNELQVYLPRDDVDTGFTKVYGGERFPYHGRFVPGSANGIGFDDLVTIEDYELLRAIAEDRPFQPGFVEALAYVSVQAALLRSWRSRSWETVQSVRID